jgi:Ca-activated chloride channel homolog
MNADTASLSFAFIRPLWLLGLLVLPALGWAFRRWRGTSGWENYIDAEKLRYLSVVTPADRSWMQPLLFTALTLACLALAGPSWRSIPLPVKQTRDAMVIAFDLSPSMLATDVKPDRLTRARLKTIDLLRLRKEGETALIAYADDAYRVSPLTDDASTIEALVPSLHPDVMPGPGSRVEAAAAMARELLAGASLDHGVLLIVTDGIDPSAMETLEGELGESMRFCILAVGGIEGVPIPIRGGGFARDEKNQTILAGLNRGEVMALANRHGGCFAELRSDDSDLEQILDRLRPDVRDDLEASDTTFDIRHDEGYWLILFLLPVAALGFRKNILWTWGVVVPVTTMATMSASPSFALDWEWADLWQRGDQREVREIEAGIERYRQGDYAGAVEHFDGESTLQHYNRGNALALAGQLEEAIESYDQALAQAPENEDARFNREIVEELLEMQQKDQDSQQGESDDRNEEDQDSQEDSESQSSDDPGQGSQSDDSKSASESSEDPSDDENQENTERSSESTTEESEPLPEEDKESEPPPAANQMEGDREQEPDSAESTQPVDAEQEPLSDRSEQWLRSIPDDPGGLMRRKFEYQAEQRRQSRQQGNRQRPNARY